jgi:hypothetical protein
MTRVYTPPPLPPGTCTLCFGRGWFIYGSTATACDKCPAGGIVKAPVSGVKGGGAMADLLAMANKVCGQLPEGWEVQLCMERGAAWVALRDTNGDFHPLPDAADKSIEEQINDAIAAAGVKEGEGESKATTPTDESKQGD